MILPPRPPKAKHSISLNGNIVYKGNAILCTRCDSIILYCIGNALESIYLISRWITSVMARAAVNLTDGE